MTLMVEQWENRDVDAFLLSLHIKHKRLLQTENFAQSVLDF